MQHCIAMPFSVGKDRGSRNHIRKELPMAHTCSSWDCMDLDANITNFECCSFLGLPANQFKTRPRIQWLTMAIRAVPLPMSLAPLADLRFCWEALLRSVHSCRHSSISRASCRPCWTPNPDPMSSNQNNWSMKNSKTKIKLSRGCLWIGGTDLHPSLIFEDDFSAKAVAECQSIEIQSKHLPQSQSTLSVSH